MSTLTILGTSASLNKDIVQHGIIGDVMVLNRTIMDYSGAIKYAVSIHEEYLNLYMMYRKMISANTYDVITFTSCKEDTPCINTSGLLALCVAQELGYDEIRVLGLSADDSGHYYDLYTTRIEDHTNRFPFDNDDWLSVFKTWSNVKVASGNLLRLFKSL